MSTKGNKRNLINQNRNYHLQQNDFELTMQQFLDPRTKRVEAKKKKLFRFRLSSVKHKRSIVNASIANRKSFYF